MAGGLDVLRYIILYKGLNYPRILVTVGVGGCLCVCVRASSNQSPEEQLKFWGKSNIT